MSPITDRLLKPDGQEPGPIEETMPNPRSGWLAGAVLSLTGFSAIWEPDVTNSLPAETRY
jgi:hypothetical protein